MRSPANRASRSSARRSARFRPTASSSSPSGRSSRTRLPLTIARFTGREHLYFFDAIAPVVEADSIDRSIVFAASRYGKGGGRGLPQLPDESAKSTAGSSTRCSPARRRRCTSSTRTPFFEGCLPIEEMARRGRDTLRFGPMKPVGLVDPRTGARPHAVVQLRQDNLAAEHYSMVGFQTQLRWPEQKRIFRMIPGLAAARVRAPRPDPSQLLHQCARRSWGPTCRPGARPGLFFAGQISGVEGYTESAADGPARRNQRRPPGHRRARRVTLPPDTMLGALCRYVVAALRPTGLPADERRVRTAARPARGGFATGASGAWRAPRSRSARLDALDS